MNLDRRKFLQQSGTSLGGFLASPQLGILGALVGSVAGANDPTNQNDAKTPLTPKTSRLLLRSGEPINARGEPFGKAVSCFSTFALSEVTRATGKTRVLAVLGHTEPPASITALEFIHDERTGRWRHDVASPRNRMWTPQSTAALEGARLIPDSPAYRYEQISEGVGPINSTCALPWSTVLCGEEWVVEINPLTGAAIKRVSLGRVRPQAIAVVTEAGKSVDIYLRDPENRLFRFRSHQRFEARQLTANASALVIGELEAADNATGQWRPLTQGLSPDAWLIRMQNPSDGVEPIAGDSKAFERELKLLRASGSQGLSFHLKHEGPEAFLYSGPLTQ